jgi:hypothetical protein
MSGPTSACDRCGQQFFFLEPDQDRMSVMSRLKRYGLREPVSFLCTSCLGVILRELKGSDPARSRRG